MGAIKLEVTKEDLFTLVEDLVDAEKEAERIEAVAEFLDAVTPAGPLEMFDGPVYRGILTLAAKAAKRDPAKVAARKARRAKRKAARE